MVMTKVTKKTMLYMYIWFYTEKENLELEIGVCFLRILEKITT